MFQDGSSRTILSTSLISRRRERISQSPEEFHKTRSHTRRRASMNLGFSSPRNWWWLTRRETPSTILDKLTELLAVVSTSIAEVHSNLAKRNWFHSLPFQRFQALLTLFSKSFSSFPHGTCILSVSNLYLASDETYHQLCAPIPRNVTLRKRTVHRGL